MRDEEIDREAAESEHERRTTTGASRDGTVMTPRTLRGDGNPRRASGDPAHLRKAGAGKSGDEAQPGKRLTPFRRNTLPTLSGSYALLFVLMNRSQKNLAKRTFFRIHRLGTRIGLQVVPVHYYSPLPNVLELEKTRSRWAKPSDLPGIAVNTTEQMKNLKTTCRPYLDEYRNGNLYEAAAKSSGVRGYGELESQILHAVVRYRKPSQVVEVGSGTSTFCIAGALSRNRAEGHASKMTCIEPYPMDSLRSLDVELISERAQDVPIRIFTQLRENDFLFIDSSHQVKAGGDVNHLILEVLPRLHPGVIVHFHDIHFPYDYPRDLLKNFFPWTETSLLRAFLTFNDHYTVLFSMSLLHYKCPDELKQVLPGYSPQLDKDGLLEDRWKPFEYPPGHFPSSIYLQVE